MNSSPKLAPSQHSLSYRPDIDGLRALAVIAVILFHAFPTLLKGGFIGVDVFFVISGFLISSIIFKGLSNNTFSFKVFYSRRIKRIFPALIIVLFVCYAVGWATLLRDEFRQLGKHIAAGALFVQNIVLWREAGYFDIQSELKPLVHLWSLSVEEQFYLVYPLLIWGAWRLKINMLVVVCLLAITSFCLNIFSLEADSVKGYFSPQTRFWELLVGAVLAYFHVTRFFEVNGQAAKNALSMVGLILICLGVLLIDKEKSFPGWWAVLPVGGAALILASGPKAIVNRAFLANPAMVFVGLISYPLYLWHWPILSFARIINSEEPPALFRIAAIILSFVLAWLTYRLIERPFKFDSRAGTKTIVLFCCLLVVGFGGYNAYKRKGLKFRTVVELNRYEETGLTYSDYSFIKSGCGLSNSQAKKMANCKRDSRGGIRFAILGDSKAAALAPGVFFKSTDKGRWLFIGGSGENSAPVPVISDAPIFAAYQPRIRDALGAVTANHSIEVVVVAAAARSLFKLKNDFSIEDLPESENYEVALVGLSKVVDNLVDAGKKVVLVVDNPTFPDARTCFRRVTAFSETMSQPDLNKCQISYSKQLELSHRYRLLLQKVQEQHPDKVRIFDPTDLLCDVAVGTCTISNNNHLLYGYSDHISDYASHLVADKLIPFVESYSEL